MAFGFSYNLRVFVRNLPRGSHRSNTFLYFVLMSDKGFMSNKPTYYLLDYDDDILPCFHIIRAHNLSSSPIDFC